MPNRSAEHRCGSADAALWRDAVRGVAPLQSRLRPSPPAPADARPGNDAGGAAERSPQAETSAREPVVGTDRATAERLKRGLRAIEARLDMHGMTQAQAYRALAEFVRASRAAGRRCVLVITGRGLRTDQPGVLKNAVPRWLAETGFRQQVLAMAAAQPHHGGAGALYLLLRRRR